MKYPKTRICLAVGALCAVSASFAQQQDSELAPVVVKGNYDNAVGSSGAASEGTVTRKLIQNRPVLRPAEVLEFVPGVIVSQHSGDGKANQYYLRGFNLDHGTDFATFVDGMPVNMPTHAHGQGYTDLNFLIPELVQGIHYRKGVYAAEDGDFSSAGSARLSLVDGLPQGLASVTLGENNYARAVLANSTALTTGQLLYAVEAAHNDGPWDNPENLRRFSGVLRYSLNDGDTRQSLTAMGYTSRWNATDQVPRSVVDSGEIGRFGAIDPSDHGDTSRASLSWDWLKVLNDGGEWHANAYAITSRLDLFSDFTYYLDDSDNTDQFEQAEKRRVYGGSLSRSWQGKLVGNESRSTLGMQLRHDRLDPVGLYSATGGERTDVRDAQEARARETMIGLYGENETRWTPWLRSVVGVRADHVDVDVSSSVPDSSGQRDDWITSPKASLVFGPWAKTEFFVNGGFGFHSNDARGMTKTDQPAVPLVKTRGGELGTRSEWLPGLQTSLALWQLKLDSEQVFIGDAGDTEPSGASTRRGIEFNNHYVATSWLTIDADLAWSHARFDTEQGEAPDMGRYVPGAVNKVGSLGVSLDDLGPWFGQFQLRYFGPRPLIEDNSVQSSSTTLAYARVGYKISSKVKLMLDVFNLFDREVSDIDYYYESQSRPTADGGTPNTEIHSHPAEPRTFRLTMNVGF